jgi:hypothetical protein
MPNVETLLRKQADLTALVETLSAHTGSRRIEAVMELRGDLNIGFLHYLRDEALYIERAFAGCEDAEETAAIAAFIESRDMLCQLWNDHISEWSVEVVSSDWDCFASEAGSLLRRIRKHAERAAALICPIAVRSGTIRLRAAA